MTCSSQPSTFEHFPIFRDAELVIADPIVRNRGTIGGSICQADPSEDLSAAFAAVRRRWMVDPLVVGREPDRNGTDDFHQGPVLDGRRATADPLTESRVPIRPGCGIGLREIEQPGRMTGPSRRWGPALGQVVDGVARRGRHRGSRRSGPRQFRAAEAEAALRGGPPPPRRRFTAAAQTLAAQACEPTSDQRGPADYKRHLAKSPHGCGRCATRRHGPTD